MSTELSRNERIKEASRFLRGTLAEGLAEIATGAIAEDDEQLVKFHGMYLQDDRDLRAERTKKKLEKAFSFMVRLRMPGRRVHAGPVARARPHRARLCQRHAAADDAADVPVPRGHQVEPARPTMQAIDAALLDTLAACGDVNRNVLADVQSAPVAGASRRARAGARDLRSSAAAHAGLSRDLARRREDRRRRGESGRADLRPHLPAAEVQDRGRGAARQRRRRLRPGPRLHRDPRPSTARSPAGTSPSAAAWA